MALHAQPDQSGECGRGIGRRDKGREREIRKEQRERDGEQDKKERREMEGDTDTGGGEREMRKGERH